MISPMTSYEWLSINSTKLHQSCNLETSFVKFLFCATTWPTWQGAALSSFVTWLDSVSFGSCDVEKVHAVVARSTCGSQNVQSTLAVGPLLQFAMLKKKHSIVARSTFGEVKTWQNTWGPRTTFGSWDVVPLSKKCTPLRREAHCTRWTVMSHGDLEVNTLKKIKTTGFRTTFRRFDVPVDVNVNNKCNNNNCQQRQQHLEVNNVWRTEFFSATILICQMSFCEQIAWV